MKKRKILIIIICILLVLIGTLLVLKFNLFGNNNKKIDKLEVNYDRQLTVCLDSNTCDLLPMDGYLVLGIKTNSKRLKNIVNNYNKDIDDLHDKVINSNLDANECVQAKDKYKYRYTTNISYDTYYDDEIVSVARQLYVRDLCTNNVITNEFKSGIYDMNTGNQLTNDEVLSKYDYTEEVVLNNINSDIDTRNDISTAKISIDNIYMEGKLNYDLYFDDDGKMMIHYVDNVNNNMYNTKLY